MLDQILIGLSPVCICGHKYSVHLIQDDPGHQRCLRLDCRCVNYCPDERKKEGA